MGDAHAFHGPLSSSHSKLEPLSLELKLKLAVVAVVMAAGPSPIVVWGAVVSAGGEASGVGEVGELIGVVLGCLERSCRRRRLARTARSTPLRFTLPGLLARSSMLISGFWATAKVALTASKPTATTIAQINLVRGFS